MEKFDKKLQLFMDDTALHLQKPCDITLSAPYDFYLVNTLNNGRQAEKNFLYATQ